MTKKLTKKKWLIIALLLISVFAIYLYNIGGYDLWSPDEPRYAEVAREVLDTGDWVIPHLNGEVYYQKPILFYDIIALFSLFIGKMSVITVRLPMILIAVALIGAITIYLTKKLGIKLAVLSGVILSTMVEFFWFAMRVNLDIPLIFCTTIAGFLLYEELEQSDSNWRSYLSFLLMAGGSLIKSPVALLPVVVIIIYTLWTKQLSSLKNIAWIKGLLIYVAVGGVWLGLAVNAAGYSYFKTTVLDQLVGYSTGSQGHPRPIYYYLINFPIQALPWSLFLIPAFFEYQSKEKVPELIKFSMIWFLSIFVILSLVGSKRGLYLLQAYPAAAIIIAWYFNNKLEEEKSAKGLKVPTIIMGLLFLVVGIYLYLQGVPLAEAELRSSLAEGSELYNAVKALTWFFIVSGGLFSVSIFAKNKKIIAAVLVAFSVGLIFTAKGIVMPAVNQVKSEKYLAQDLAKLKDKSDQVLLLGSRNRDSGFIFYNGIYFDKVINDKQVSDYLNHKNDFLLVATDADKFYELTSKQQRNRLMIKEYRIGSDQMLLIDKE